MRNSDLASSMAADRRLIDATLKQSLSFNRAVPLRLVRAMRYAALGPGKRIRPVLALLAFRAAGGRREKEILPFCCGIEMIHAFSLVHDDLPSMDDDDLRRGRPSLHRAFDEATAILAADALFARAFELFSDAPGDNGRKIEAIRVICRAVGPEGMTGGQMLDISGGRPHSERQLARLHLKKTAEFMASALVAGAIVGGAGADVQGTLWQAGISLGRLFQATDDMLDRDQPSDRGRLTVLGLASLSTAGRRARGQALAARRFFVSLGKPYRSLSELPDLILKRVS